MSYLFDHNLLIMTLGAALLWITIILLIIFGIRFVTKNKKWKLVGKITGIIVLIALLISAGVWIWNWNKNRPYQVQTLGDISLGMSPLDITLALGKPNADNDTAADGDRRIVYLDYVGTLNYFVRFSRENDEEYAATICTRDYSHKIFGLGKYNTEKEVTKKLGEPTSISVRSDGLAKMISYAPWKVAYEIEKGDVKGVCITKNTEVRFLEELNS